MRVKTFPQRCSWVCSWWRKYFSLKPTHTELLTTKLWFFSLSCLTANRFWVWFLLGSGLFCVEFAWSSVSAWVPFAPQLPPAVQRCASVHCYLSGYVSPVLSSWDRLQPPATLHVISRDRNGWMMSQLAKTWIYRRSFMFLMWKWHRQYRLVYPMNMSSLILWSQNGNTIALVSWIFT